MAKNQPISTQITLLEEENQRLKCLEKLFLKFIKKYYELSEKNTFNSTPQKSDFEARITAYFCLGIDEKSKEEFLNIMLNESALEYFNSKRSTSNKQDS